ncbi:Ring finger domain [seawater metagenome]|uniref:Ring finger domain n=1 Tax=seawater metagenome TaxID=1561972 RepID=A0A5E8CKK8_9ZZZZ
MSYNTTDIHSTGSNSKNDLIGGLIVGCMMLFGFIILRYNIVSKMNTCFEYFRIFTFYICCYPCLYFYGKKKDAVKLHNKINKKPQRLPKDFKSKYQDCICPICMEDIIEDNGDIIEDNENNIILLKCNHIFHKKCLAPWLEHDQSVNPKNCPLCRDKIKISNVYAI